jgi:hypothetical protein
MEYRKIRNKKHYIYDHISEFYNDHPEETPLKDWRNANEGDWVWSDDNKIVQLLKVSNSIKHPNDRKNYKYASGYVRTVVGTFLKTKGVLMDTDFSKHPNRYTFSGKNPKSVKERKGITNKEKIFATNVAVGMGPVKAYMDAFNSDDELQSRRKATLLLKQERVMQEVEKSVLDVAKGLGLDHEYILNKLKCLADNSSDDGIVLQSTKELAKIIGTSGTTVKSREMGIVGMFQGFSPEQIENAERPQLKEVKGEIDEVS